MHSDRNALPVAADTMGVLIRQINWGMMTISVESFPAGLETAPIFVGLPEDRCQCPHWGYVVSGRFRAVYADRQDVISAGEVFYLEPGHTTIFEEQTETIEFSPAGEYEKTMEVVGRNVMAMQAGQPG